MTFTSLDLDPTILRAIEDEGYAEPTPIQRHAIPKALEGHDVVGSAQTGTGKTAAFLWPILHRLKRSRQRGTRALVLVPTRELAEQVVQRARAYGRHCHLGALAVYGGVGMEPQTRALRKGVDIVVATPGRLLDHMSRRHVDLSRIEMLVLDEADRMLDMGFARDIDRILEAVPTRRQTLFFSATVSANVDRLARRALTDPAAIEIGARAETAEGVDQTLLAVDKANKRHVLLQFLEGEPGGRTLVFTRTRYGADRLVRHLQRVGTEVAALHGGKTQQKRSRALERFRTGETQVLVATDVAARGIDVSDIRTVVNFDVPNDPEVYVHRIGRTARAGTRGVALTLMSPDEWVMMRDVEKLIGRVLPREVAPGFEPSVEAFAPRERTPIRRGPSVRSRRGGSRRR